MDEEFTSCEQIVQADPRWQEAMRRRGVDRLRADDDRPVGVELDRAGGRPVGPAHRAPADLAARGARRARLRAPGRGPGRGGRPGRRRGGRGGGPRVVPFPTQPGNYEEPWLFEEGNVPAVAGYRDDLKPIEISQPEGPSFTVDGHAVSWQQLAAADRVHPARGAGAAPGRLRRPADHLSGLAGRDVRPLRRPGTDPPVQERVRPGRVRHRLAGQLAHPGLRLRRAHPLLRRRGQRQRRRRGDHPERGVHARGGRRDRLEAHRLPHRCGAGAAPAPAGDLHHRHRRELRVRLLLVPLHRRHHRVRGQADRGHLHRRDRARGEAEARHAGRARPVRAHTTSTSSACGWT